MSYNPAGSPQLPYSHGMFRRNPIVSRLFEVLYERKVSPMTEMDGQNG